jgi:hypothetical protein
MRLQHSGVTVEVEAVSRANDASTTCMAQSLPVDGAAQRMVADAKLEKGTSDCATSTRQTNTTRKIEALRSVAIMLNRGVRAFMVCLHYTAPFRLSFSTGCRIFSAP